jgi:tetratricopeptide repeat protein 8
MLMDENAVASVARPGTSLSTPRASSKSGSYDQGMRPVTQSGRPVTGFARPVSSRPMSGLVNVRDTLQSSSRRAGTARPMTTLGREVRLGTASLAASATGALVDVEKLNVKKYAKKTGLAMVLTDYLLCVEHNTRKALELCAEATKESDFKNWWWKARLGKCYFKLGTRTSASEKCYIYKFPFA